MLLSVLLSVGLGCTILALSLAVWVMMREERDLQRLMGVGVAGLLAIIGVALLGAFAVRRGRRERDDADPM